jgi:hypothetical protein
MSVLFKTLLQDQRARPGIGMPGLLIAGAGLLVPAI